MRINYESDETQSQFVDALARRIYKALGYNAPINPNYLWESQHPTEQMMIQLSEEIFEVLTGDSPDYGDDEE